MGLAEFVAQISAVFGTNQEHDIVVDNTLLVVGSGDLARNFAESNSDKYKITATPFIKDYSGSLGGFRVSGTLNFPSQAFSQIVFFSDFSEPKKPQLGIHFVSDYDDEVALCAEIDALIGDFSFTKTILFDEKKCQFFHRNKTEFSYCADCAAVCPTMAISADDTKRELIFSQIDCILCGKCVGVCPSSAMQKSNATLTNFSKALKFYKGKIAVLCESVESFEKFSAESSVSNLPKDSLVPLVLPNINMLNEAYLLSILQESGRVCVIIGDSSDKNNMLDAHLRECVEFINDLYNRVVGQNAVFVAESNEIAESTFAESSAESKNIFGDTHLPYYHYEISNDEFLREIVANRVRFLIKDDDFGALKNSANLIYTDLKIIAEKCTLCNACVESCNTNALINAKDSFTLLLNPSLCTACGYCVDTCAEKCIEMDFSGYKLNENFLTHRILAQDEPFKCVECGEIYATKKSIQKVKGILQPLFAGDSVKLKSLECCEKCKVKIMFEKSSNFIESQRSAK